MQCPPPIYMNELSRGSLCLKSFFQQLQDTNKEATTKLSQFQGQKDQLEKKDNELRTRKKELQSQKSRKKTLENNIQMKLKM